MPKQVAPHTRFNQSWSINIATVRASHRPNGAAVPLGPQSQRTPRQKDQGKYLQTAAGLAWAYPLPPWPRHHRTQGIHKHTRPEAQRSPPVWPACD